MNSLLFIKFNPGSMLGVMDLYKMRLTNACMRGIVTILNSVKYYSC